MNNDIKLYGRILLTGDIRLVTGLHVGISKETLDIGGVDMPIIRDPRTQEPYLPGSSLRGKMRSQWEKFKGVPQNWNLSKGREAPPREAKDVVIHLCTNKAGYDACPVCQIYGVPGDKDSSNPTRLIVRDVRLDITSLAQAKVDRFTEVKAEAAIDRVTSAATPRSMERIPAGAILKGMELVFSVYTAADRTRFGDVLTALQLVEDDYLGGQGSRGSGKVAFENLAVTLKTGANYAEITESRFRAKSLADLIAARSDLVNWIEDKIKVNGGG